MNTKLLLSVIFFLAAFAGQAQTNTIDRPGFKLQFPQTWVIDTADADYDPDALFSLEGPDGNSLAMFIIFNTGIDAPALLDLQVREFKKSVIKKPTSEKDFQNWSSLKGSGKELKGKMMGVFAGTVRIFTFSDADKAMLVVFQHSNEDLPQMQKDLQLIEQSFSFK